MAKLAFTKDNLPSSDEFRALLDQTEPMSETEYLFDLSRELFTFEDKYNMTSESFYGRFMRGEMGDDMPFIKWAGCYELYLETKHEIDVQMAKATVPA